MTSILRTSEEHLSELVRNQWAPLDWPARLALRGVSRELRRVVSLQVAGLRAASGGVMLRTLTPFLGLCRLDLSGCAEGLVDSGLAPLPLLGSLTDLKLKRCDRLTDDGMQHVARCPALTSLNLYECRGITDKGIATLIPLTRLTDLDLGWCREVTDAGLKALGVLTRLASLSLYWCVQVTDAGVEALGKLKSLTSLNLGRCDELTDAGLHCGVSLLTGLRVLDLSGCSQVSHHGLGHLVHLSRLESIILYVCIQVCDKWLFALTPFIGSLTSLNLYWCGLVTDAGLHAISRLTKLTDLNLGRCDRLTDAGVVALSALTKLSSLNLYACEQ
eukprot:gene16151-19160_t